ncbi:hypothetical protein SH601_01750 [Gracilibacillus sp. S3-1-1]|uniref:Uncharacterized protein n=1 Tax=Gracilibacillus pellucidus TaxID=3095368 RepID=A0ACC6M1U2_9BACI|nr:hypothetical protein [Gracilibacillus sp. S3-1-1]MDX8044697.1 hypothetical protein [Gracilibacillus sp. S3-1-1]
MNEYTLESLKNLDEQLREWARKDAAPLIRVFTSNKKDFSERTLYREFMFEEYECNCAE